MPNISRKPTTAGSDRRSGMASAGRRRRRSAPKNMTRTPSSSPAMNAKRKRKVIGSAAEGGTEERDRQRPGLSSCREVGAGLTILLTQESVSGSGESVGLEALSESLHG